MLRFIKIYGIIYVVIFTVLSIIVRGNIDIMLSIAEGLVSLNIFNTIIWCLCHSK